MIVEPRVKLIASTCIEVDDNMQDDALTEWMETRPEFTAAEMLTEFAGRSCYQSWSRPNPATADTGDYLRRTLFEQAHWSIAEHASATFYITGVSRALTHELIRHRHLSYSQLSQRFVNEEDANIVIPPALSGKENGLAEHMDEALSFYEWLVKERMGAGVPRKQAREAARAVLPNMTETRIVVTGNMRAWHEFLGKRLDPAADAEMRKVAGLIADGLHEVAPNIFPKEAGASHVDHADGEEGDRQVSSELSISLDSRYDKKQYEEFRAELAAIAKDIRQIAADFSNLGG